MEKIFTSSIRIGSARFEVLLKEGFSDPRGSVLPRFHCHPDYELHCIEKGCFTFRFDAGSRVVQAPALLLLPPRIYHGFESMSEGAEKCCFEFNLFAGGEGRTFGEYAALLAKKSGAAAYQTDFPALSPFKDLSAVSEEETHYRLSATLGFVLLALFDAMRADPLPQSGISVGSRQYSAEQTLLLSRVVQYIEKNFMRPLTLQEVADSVHLSSRQTERILKDGMQEGFLALLNRYRIRMAVLRMMEGERDLTALAEAVGFANYPSFWKHFARYNGVSPSAFARMLDRSGKPKT